MTDKFDTFVPSANKYVPRFRKNTEVSQEFKLLECVNKNRKITEHYADKYINVMLDINLETIQEQKEE